MIQAIGLTSKSRKELPPAVDDVSFEARTGRVTALLGAADAGKTTVLRLMLELQQGRGVTYFRGRPLHRIAHPSREVGVLLGEVPGHPARSVRGHLRMLCAAVGVPVLRADDVLEAVGLVSLRGQPLGTLSRGMDRRLALACALLADPHTLVLDGPADGLSAREGAWLHGFLRAHAARGGTVLYSTSDSKEAARTADRVVTLEAGRVTADQEAGEFARTRLRPRVAVRTPHAARLAVLLTKEARARRRPVEVVEEDGNRLSVYGSTCADVGETAFRHGILVHHLADEIGDAGASAGRGLPPEAELEVVAPERAPGGSTKSTPHNPRSADTAPPDVTDASTVTLAPVTLPEPAPTVQLLPEERKYADLVRPDAEPEHEPPADPGAEAGPTLRAGSPAAEPWSEPMGEPRDEPTGEPRDEPKGEPRDEPGRPPEPSPRHTPLHPLVPLRPLDGGEPPADLTPTRAMGAYMTPPDAARLLAAWALRRPGERVVEPSMGEGSFLAALADGDKHKPQVEMSYIQKELQDQYHALMKRHGFSGLDAARAGVVLCSVLFQLHSTTTKEIDPYVAAGIVAQGIIEAAKTMPPPLKSASP